MPYFVDNQPVPRLPRFGRHSGQLVLHRQDRARLDECVNTFGVAVHHPFGPLSDGLIIGSSAGLQTELPHHLVLVQRRWPHHLRPPSDSPEAVVLHVPEAVLSGHEALGEKSVAFAACTDVGNAVAVAVDLHGICEPR